MKEIECSSADDSGIEPIQTRYVSPVIWLARKAPEGKIVHSELGLVHRDLLKEKDIRAHLEEDIRNRLNVVGDIGFFPVAEVDPVRVFSNTGKSLPNYQYHEEQFCFATSDATGEEKRDKFGQARSARGMEIMEDEMKQYRPFSDPDEEARCEQEWIEWQKEQAPHMVATLPETIANMVEEIRSKINHVDE